MYIFHARSANQVKTIYKSVTSQQGSTTWERKEKNRPEA